MSTLTAFLVAFFASFGAPVHHCNGAVAWGADTSCDRAAPPPPDALIVVEEHRSGAPRQISNGL